MDSENERVSLVEAFGLRSMDKALRDSAIAVFGKGKVPPTKFDLSSMSIFKPRISIPTWLGRKRDDRLIPIYNFFNRVAAPKDEVYSVRVSFARDFRGRRWTYDSHFGTDFAIPVGTHVTAAAPGKVIRILNQLDHGGLKLVLDHGQGLITTNGHLSRALVAEGDTVARGQSIALSGAAGVEIIIFFPWVAPHLHLTVLLNGNPTDPFAMPGETSLWRNDNDPLPHTGPRDYGFEPTVWNKTLIDNAIAECTDASERKYLRSITDIEKRAAETINYRMFYNTLFSSFPPLYEKEYERRPIFDLPFRARDFDGAFSPDDL